MTMLLLTIDINLSSLKLYLNAILSKLYSKSFLILTFLNLDYYYLIIRKMK